MKKNKIVQFEKEKEELKFKTFFNIQNLLLILIIMKYLKI